MGTFQDVRDVDVLIDAIGRALESPSELDEVGVIHEARPTTLPTNPLVCLDTSTPRCLGVRSWSLASIYCGCRVRLRGRTWDEQAILAVLFVNPDYNSAWNARKCHIEKYQYDDELRLVELLLAGRMPKSCDTWAHRHWVLRQAGRACLRRELRIGNVCATRAFSNYYAQVHRVRVLQWATTTRCKDEETVTVFIEGGGSVSCELLDEVVRQRKWLATHVGDSAGWAYHRALFTVARPFNGVGDYGETVWFHRMLSSYEGTFENVRLHLKWLRSIPWNTR